MQRSFALEPLLGALTIGVWMLVFRGSPAQESAQTTPETLVVEELVVKRLRVIEEDGSDRVVLAGSARFPRPRLGGREYPRSIAPAGMVFYRANGDECGGLAIIDTPQGTGNMVILDYANNDAIGLGVREAPGGVYSAGMTIADRPPLDADPLKAASMVRERLSIGNSAGRAEILLSDPLGRTRIALAVDQEGQPSLRILDEDGTPLFEAP